MYVCVYEAINKNANKDYWLKKILSFFSISIYIFWIKIITFIIREKNHILKSQLCNPSDFENNILELSDLRGWENYVSKKM